MRACRTRSWLRPATAMGSYWIEPKRRKNSRTASMPPTSDSEGASNWRATRKRRATSAVTSTPWTLAASPSDLCSVRPGRLPSRASRWPAARRPAKSQPAAVATCGRPMTARTRYRTGTSRRYRAGEDVGALPGAPGMADSILVTYREFHGATGSSSSAAREAVDLGRAQGQRCADRSHSPLGSSPPPPWLMVCVCLFGALSSLELKQAGVRPPPPC